MAKSIRITIPNGLTPTKVAETFAAYLLGPLAYECTSQTDPHWQGPFQNEKGNDKHWQLDTANDFFLHVDADGRHAALNCRYEGREEAMLKAMADLFNLRYGRWETIGPVQPVPPESTDGIDGEEQDVRASRDMPRQR